MSYIKENIITKLQKLYSLPRNLEAGNKSPALFLKKPLCTGDLLPAPILFIERFVSVADILFIPAEHSKYILRLIIFCTISLET